MPRTLACLEKFKIISVISILYFYVNLATTNGPK